MNTQDTTKKEAVTPPIQSLSQFCRASGISSITAWRFRRRGWLQTTNIAGRQYVTREAVVEFKRRASAGEFAKVHTVPTSPFARAHVAAARVGGALKHE